ncbi:hypothetical protein TNIN_249351 [Trichonephila inaurata madagascariensis]|uniref:Uncharacterized protein n=1 Tax=Trichonephila inaurata madagascariensis TaxID=2747483 RepID=A0A8X7C2M6_9ARAC|nr:hypothetical protein TNIN_249351 [Trichonephila inaurata madagascariensis]
MTKEASLRLSISQNNVFNLTTDIRKCWTGFRATTPSFQTPHWTLISRGTTQVKKSIVLPSARQIFAFQHFSSHFGALTCTGAGDEVEGCAWGRHTLSVPLRDTEKGVSPVERASVGD